MFLQELSCVFGRKHICADATIMDAYIRAYQPMGGHKALDRHRVQQPLPAPSHRDALNQVIFRMAVEYISVLQPTTASIYTFPVHDDYDQLYVDIKKRFFIEGQIYIYWIGKFILFSVYILKIHQFYSAILNCIRDRIMYGL